jgi:hypothetical protein
LRRLGRRRLGFGWWKTKDLNLELLDSELEVRYSGSSQALMCACDEVVNLRLVLFKIRMDIFFV